MESMLDLTKSFAIELLTLSQLLAFWRMHTRAYLRDTYVPYLRATCNVPYLHATYNVPYIGATYNVPNLCATYVPYLCASTKCFLHNPSFFSLIASTSSAVSIICGLRQI